MRSHAGDLASGAGIALVGKLFGKSAHLVTQVALARLLGPAAFGLYAIGWTAFRALSVALPLGLDKGILRFGAAQLNTDRSRFRGTIHWAALLATLAGVACGALFFWLSPWLASVVFNKPELTSVLRWFSLVFPLYPLMRVACATSLLSKKTTYSVVAEDVVQPLFNLLLILVLAAGGLTLARAVGATVASFGLGTAAAVVASVRLYPELKRPLGEYRGVGELLAFSLPAVSLEAFSSWMTWADKLFIGALLPAESAGVYQAASQAVVLFAVILGAFNVIFAPLVAEIVHTGTRGELEQLYRTATRWGLYLSGPLFAILLAEPALILSVIFGEAYAEGAIPLVVLLSGQVVNLATGGVALLLVLAGRERRWLLISGTALLANLALNALLIPPFGLVGAAAATSLSIAALYLSGLIAVRWQLEIWPYDAQTLKIAAAAAAAFLAAKSVSFWNGASDQAWALLVVLTAMTTFGLILLATGFAEEDRRAIEILHSKLLRPSDSGDPADRP